MGNSWQTQSGLLDDYDFDVTEAWFGEDEENDDDRIFLFLRGRAETDDGEVDDEHRERYSTGANWEAVEDGEQIENAANKEQFNRNTGMGRLIDTLVELGDDVAQALAERGEAYVAATFNNVTMHMTRRIVSKWTDDDTGEDLQWELALPTSVDFNSSGKKKKSKGGGSKKGSKAKSGGKSKAKAKGKKSLRDRVVGFAAKFGEDEHDKFIDEVLDEETWSAASDIYDNDELHAEVLDPDSDLWDEAHP